VRPDALRGPGRGRVIGDGDVHDSTAVVGEEDEDVELDDPMRSDPRRSST